MKIRSKSCWFGTSRSFSIDQTHLTAHASGTFGYMDLYFLNRFAEKSDAYSFGIVLVDLLTGQKPIWAITRSRQGDEDYTSLVTYFTTSMQEDRLFDVVDVRVLKEGSETEIRVVANLVIRCLNMNGRNSPITREVTTELEAIQMSETTCWKWNLSIKVLLVKRTSLYVAFAII